MIIIFLACLAALFVGWSLGPALVMLPEKYTEVKEKIQDSVKRSEEKSKIESKFYHTVGLPMFDEQKASKKGTRNEALLATLIFGFLAFALLTGYSLFWKLLGLSLLLIFWKQLLGLIRELLLGAKKK